VQADALKDHVLTVHGIPWLACESRVHRKKLPLSEIVVGVELAVAHDPGQPPTRKKHGRSDQAGGNNNTTFFTNEQTNKRQRTTWQKVHDDDSSTPALLYWKGLHAGAQAPSRRHVQGRDVRHFAEVWGVLGEIAVRQNVAVWIKLLMVPYRYTPWYGNRVPGCLATTVVTSSYHGWSRTGVVLFTSTVSYCHTGIGYRV
jgi:hypothetical protein